MKSILKLLFATCVSLFTFAACDEIEEKDFLIRMQETSEEVPVKPSPSKQRVLLEDYTGWRCTNCPKAAALIKQLHTKFGDQLLVMAVHGGPFAKPNNDNNNLDLRTTKGEEFITTFSVSSFPSGLINRKSFGGTWETSSDTWETHITTLLAQSDSHTLDLNLGAKVLNSDHEIIITTETEFLAEKTQALNISIVILENEIKGVQKNSDNSVGDVPTITDYTFNHVLRANGSFDNPLTTATETHAAGKKIKKSYKITCDPIWKLDRCEALVYISDANTKEILQVNKTDW